MRSLVFNVDGGPEQALVQLYDDGAPTIAFRPDPFATWGIPREAIVDESDPPPACSDLDSGPRPLPKHMQAAANIAKRFTEKQEREAFNDAAQGVTRRTGGSR